MIKDKEALCADTHIEDKKELVYERKEVVPLKKQCSNYFAGKDPAFFKLINGPSGSGKTLSIRYILYNLFMEHPEFSNNFIYVNGTDIRTPKAMFQYILHHLGVRNPSKGDISSLISGIKKKLRERKSRFLFILDEVDKIYHNSRESPKWLFLHSLNRMDIKPRHAIIMVTNNFNLTRNFSTELTANLAETVFEAYTAEDIFKILHLRAKYCLDKNSYNDEDLQKIARDIYKNPIGGDQANARCALNILRNAAVTAQEKKTKMGVVVEEAIASARISDLTLLLKKYNTHLLVLIKAMAQLKQKESVGLYQYSPYGSDIDLEDIKKRFYDLSSEEGIRPISERQIYYYLIQLTDEHLITKINRSRYCFTENAEDILFAVNRLFQKR